jgi:hypothetical protein
MNTDNLSNENESPILRIGAVSCCRFIFLDIDGVIATPNTLEDGMWGLTPEKQDLLGMIIEKTDSKIVLISSWRKHTLQDTIEYMNEKGFKYADKIIGITLRAYHYIEKGIHLSIPRGVEIKQWIDTNVHSNNGKDWNRKQLGKDWNYVILDDDSDMLLEHKDNFIQCDSMEGLTIEQANKAIEVLSCGCS